MLSKAMKLAGVVAMTLALALGESAALAGSEDAAYSVAQGEGPATLRP
ncbi:hypothetical protein ACWCO0_29225 [Streptomyces tubercidicus]|nr:hypothetical protein [Streptomyces tubercidicus]WAU13671.1 hypothetical protein STRTU_004197 [Streptomyces tubercidicus]